MAKTLDNVVDEARLMLKDRRAPYRYTDTDVLESINSGFREIKATRPDIYLSPAGNIPLPSYVPADIGTLVAFPIDEIFFLPLVFFTVGKLQLGDDEFTLDNRAMTLMSSFRRMLVGG